MSAEAKTTVEQGVVLEYFCTENTVDEWRTREGDELKSKKELVFHRTQRDALNNTPGTYYN